MASEKKNWVDFKVIKERVSIEMVLGYYGLERLKKSGKNRVGCCPIHKGSNPRQFSVDPARNIFNCFGNCKAGGNVLDFVALMEFENKEMESIRKAGLLIQQWFDLGELIDQPEQGSPDPKKQLVRKEEKDQAEAINPPLPFQLKNLDPDHGFCKERGIRPATIEHFGLGYCSKGMMKGRIVIPIHDHQEQLVAYCGRAVNDDQIEQEGKYKMPANFVKSEVVYNLHRQNDPGRLILVESFLSVFQLHQNDFENVVALMGSNMSEQQEELIVNTLGIGGEVILLFDGDGDGQKCTLGCLTRLSKKLFVKTVDINPYAKKPHRLDSEAIKKLLS